MNIIMNDSKIVTFAQIEEIVKTVSITSFVFTSHTDTYAWINEVFNRFAYHTKGRTKKEKMLIRRYIKRYTTYSTSQITRLVREKKKTGTLTYSKGKKRHRYRKIYTPEDAKLLAEADNVYRRMSGDAMRAVFKDEYLVYEKKEYERLSNISHGQFYRLRETDAYKEKALTVGRTISVSRSIGIRKKPQPNGKPGFVRADTVHQGDLDGVKGVYHINLVDEVTQWEILICVDSITEHSMASVLQTAFLLFPFNILNFHSDNGGENINGSVSEVLQKLLIEQTKSRSGKCNDNALIESKNGSVVRKHMGHWHIPKYEAREINIFYRDCFNEFLNFHRMCAYPTTIISEHGKRKKIYEETMTPIQKLLSIPNVLQYLREDITVQSLKEKMRRMSHLEYAKVMHEKKQKLLAKVKKC
jgi:hypothetical protein